LAASLAKRSQTLHSPFSLKVLLLFLVHKGKVAMAMAMAAGNGDNILLKVKNINK